MRPSVFLLALLAPGPAIRARLAGTGTGTSTGQALMDARHPHLMWMLGVPMEFVVNDLRQSGNLAFARYILSGLAGPR